MAQKIIFQYMARASFWRRLGFGAGLISVLVLGSVRCATLGSSGDVKLPGYRDITLKNGLKVLIVEDHTLPYISVGLLVKSGGSQDPLGKSGLSDLTAELLERGTNARSAVQLADAFGQLGTSFSADVDYDYTYLSTSGLAESQDELLGLFFEVATQPSFSVKEVNRAKSETVAEIKRAYDHPSYVAGRVYSQWLFGPHPYGRSLSGSIRDVQSIRQKDVIRHYLKYYRPNNSWLVLVGDLKSDIIDIVTEKTSNWESRTVDVDKLPPLSPLKGRSIQLVNRRDLKQSEVRIGHYGVKRNIEDYLALSVADTILSGGFSSRLMKEIRVKRGLTYGIDSSFDPRLEVGPFTISAGTRHEKVGELVTETLKIFSEFFASGVTEDEVATAKGYLRGVFPRRIETSDQLARMLVALRFYGIDDEYLTDYMDNLDSLSVGDINGAIKKYYDPDNVRITIYGPKDKVLDPLRPVGTIEVKEYRELL